MVTRKHTFTILFWLGAGITLFFSLKGLMPPSTASQMAASPSSPAPQVQRENEAAGAATRRMATQPDRAPRSEVFFAGEPSPDLPRKMERITALRREFTRDSVMELASFLKDFDEVVIREALDSLGHIGLNSDLRPLILELLLDKILGESFAAQGDALLTAAMLDENGQLLPAIDLFAASGDQEQMAFAVRAMSITNAPDNVAILEKIIPRLQSTDVLRNALTALAKLDTPQASEILRGNLLSQDERLQSESVWALSRFKSERDNATLIEAMAAGQLSSESLAILAASPVAPQVLGSVLQREDIPIETKAAWLGLLEEQAPLASGETRAEMATLMEGFFDSPDPAVEIAAIRMLRNLSLTEDKTSVLLPKLRSANPQVQLEALTTYATFCTPGTYKPLLDLYWHEDEKIRRTAFGLSLRFLNASDLELLKRAGQHEDAFISEQARNILAKIQ